MYIATVYPRMHTIYNPPFDPLSYNTMHDVRNNHKPTQHLCS